MNEPFRVLALQTQGDEVALLHGSLLELGHAIAPDELAAAAFGPTTHVAIVEIQRKNGQFVTGAMDEITAAVLHREMAARPRRRRVLGTVRHPNGRPAEGLTVRAFDRDLRREQPLGEAQTDGRGFYHIPYTHEQFARAEKGAADLILRVFQGKKTVYDPPMEATLFNAPDVAVINVILPAGDAHTPSEFERILRSITPLLDGLALDALAEDKQTRDLTFLMGETGFPLVKLEHFAVAQKLAAAYKIVPEFFYALFAEHTLLKASHTGATGVRFDITLDAALPPLFYDVVLLPAETVKAAVLQAVTDQFVPDNLPNRLDGILEQLARSLPEARAYVADQRPKLLFQQVEQFLAAGKHEQVMNILKEDTFGDLPGLFTRLQEAAAFQDGQKAVAAETGAALQDLLGFDSRIIDGVRAAQGIAQPEDISRLARLNRAEWSGLLRTAATDANPVMVGDHPMRAELVDMHASVLARKMEKRFPTPAFAAQLERDPTVFKAHRDEMLALFADHPNLDLANTNIDRLLGTPPATASAAGSGQTPNAAPPAAPVGDMKGTLKAVQRVFKVAPTFRQTTALMDAGVRSSAAIHAMGETRFVQQFAREGVFTPDEAHVAFHKAADLHTAGGLLAGELQAATSAMKVSALKGIASSAKLEAVSQNFPNMKSLFQLADYCACEECRSVHSAAEYVADTLQFLKNRYVADTTVGPPTLQPAKDVLFARRPDIGDTDLNCANTNTTIAHIDLVCELLEEAVAPDPGIPFNGVLASGVISHALLVVLQVHGLPFTDQAVIYDADVTGHRVVRDKKVVCKLTSPDNTHWSIRRLHQTYGTQAEVMAAPEYVNPDAYITLAASDFAFRLPFDLFHQETRAYFTQFDISRADLMRALQIAGGPLENQIAAEGLGLSDEERHLIATADPGNQNTFWNTGGTPAADVVKVVDTFVTKAEFTYKDLLDLLDRTWVNPGNAMFVQDMQNDCDLAHKEIRSLDNAALDRLHRFIRLWKKTGWTTTAIDRMIRAPRLGNTVLDDACLVKMEQSARLAGRLVISLDELCNLFDVLPTDDDNSRYAQVFLNLSANGTIEADFRPDRVHQNELDELAVPGSGKKLAAYRVYLALCLGLKQAEAALLIDSLALPGPPVVQAPLSAVNIASVYALSLLARKLRLTVSDLLILKDLTAIDILASPANALRFLDKVETVRKAGVKPADLKYLLTHKADDLNDRIFRDSAITAFLAGLQKGYQALFVETRPAFAPTSPADENKNSLRSLLAKLPNLLGPDRPRFPEADLSRFQNIVDDHWLELALTPAQYIDQKLGDIVDTVPIKAAQAALAPAAPPKEVERNAFIKSVSDAVSAYLYRAGKQEQLEAAVIKQFKVAEEAAPVLLQIARLKQPVAAGNRTLQDLLTDDALIDAVNTPPVPPAIVAAAYDDQYRALRLLSLMTPFLVSLKLPTEGIRWMLQNNAALGWLELDNLTYQSGTAAVNFDSWEGLQEILTLLAAYPPVDNPSDAPAPFTVYGLFDLVLAPGTVIADLSAYLVRLTGWDAALLTDLDARFGFSVGSLNAYRLPATYKRLVEAVNLLRQLGLGVASGVSVSKPVLTPADSALMRTALKARYDESEWLGVLGRVQDPLREQKRNALVAYLLCENPSLKSSDDLYDYFLIDVEMTACMATSRIVQAHATIQLFAQRCLMGLEPKSVANIKDDVGWQQWKWMANFRVWEANRKIFLWPENWIDPFLRDDKSELFTNLENTLQQNELTDRAVEDAAIAYLEQLDDIAQMDVMATYYQIDIRTMHVFARTKGGDPAVYYYRQFQQERYWTPWEKVDLDIAGDHLVAFDRNSRLTLAWPIFTSEADDSTTVPVPKPTLIPDAGQPTEKPHKRWKIQLAVSERAGDKWTPKKVSKDALYSPDSGYFSTDPPLVETYSFFEWNLGGGGQAISCTNVNPSLWVGSFALTGCKGYPEPHQGGSFRMPLLPQFKDAAMRADRFTELGRDTTDDLAIQTIFNVGAYDTIVNNTPGTFRVTYPMQMSLIDWVLVALEFLISSQKSVFRERGVYMPLGTFMPYFYGDSARTYAIIPGFYETQAEDPKKRIEKMFSDIEKFTEDVVRLLTTYLLKYVQDPAHDLNKIVQALSVDPEFIRLQQELQVYQSLQFGLKFKNFYHPLICFLRSTFNRQGFPALMQRDVQMTDTGFDFATVYNPTALVVRPYPREDLDFDRDGAYSAYNWELFFHLPFEIAMRLNQDQRFDEARAWFHYIFNPMDATGAAPPNKYWITKPFFLMNDYFNERIDNLLNAIAADPSGATIPDLRFAVSEWRTKPFKPHVIARSRPVAYQIAVVVRYVKNLIDQGDYLFRQFTRESVNLATQMYILADELMGSKPRIVPSALTPPVETYNQLEAKLDLFSNALLDLENLIPDLGLLPHHGAELPPAPITVSSLYFCIPPNENLLQNWDLVADRLLKIRHCQNIDGVEASLALFSPPIDPGDLVRAAAAGLDISAFLAGLSAPLPNYRFSVMSQKATELVQQVGVLGSSLLQALEKRDAEKLSRIRSEQELSVLGAVREVKLATIKEAQSTAEGLHKTRAVTEERRGYYAGQSYMNAWEITAVTLSGLSLIGEAAVAVGYILSGGLKLIPDIAIGAAGFGGTPEVTATIGSGTFGNSAEDAVKTIESIIRALDKGASMASTQGGYQRRQDDWSFQVRLADKELAQIDQQIATANLHLDMLGKELTAHDLQITNAKATDGFLHTKYTNQELYDWMIGQVSAVYFQAYKLAFDVSKKAERCFQHELGSDSTFLKFGYWDSLKKGLMTADALHHDLKRMEVAYLDQNKREYELTKSLSLAQLDPFALVQLKNTGKCTVQVPEAVFDLDHPGHIMRRLQSVSLSIPCVAGPHTTVSCKLSLISNRYRKNTQLHAGEYKEAPGDDRFVYNVGAIQSISTSTSQSDSGLFESRDDRYRPFEGTGAVGTWQLEMPALFPQFDYNTISDVILHLRYTAREGGSTFKSVVETALHDLFNDMTLAATRQGLFQAFNLRQDMSNEWHRLKQTNATQLTLRIDNLPFFVHNHTPTVDRVTWMVRVKNSPAVFTMTLDGAAFAANRDSSLNNLCVGSSNLITLGTPFTLATANAADVEEIVVLLHYVVGV